MNVATYHENLFGDKSAELQLWRQQWERAGFTTNVYDEGLCRQHPRYNELVEKIRHYPTVNVRRYEDICYLRWLGAGMILKKFLPSGAILVQSDTDVLPFRLGEADIISAVNNHKRHTADHPGVVAVFDRGVVPCLVALDEAGADWVVDALCTKGDQGDPFFVERPGAPVHMSDMLLFQWLHRNVRPLIAEPLCVQFGDKDKTDPRIDWQKSPAVHFSAGAVGQFRPGWDKTRAMRIEILERASKG